MRREGEGEKQEGRGEGIKGEKEEKLGERGPNSEFITDYKKAV